MNIDFNNIRPLNGKREDGFEELCAQLAREEKPKGAKFYRKGTPDAGVECYAVLNDGSEWGWQAKYFRNLGDSQWSQLNESVKTAIEKHPRLVRYFVCVPLDRPDARMPNQKSAKEKWDEHVIKWKAQATTKGMVVEFVYWGRSELLGFLSRPEHFGRVRFWFDIRGFDAAWFNEKLDDAVRTAGPRYTPQVHIGLPIASALETLGRTASLFEQVRSKTRNIQEKSALLTSTIDLDDVDLVAISSKAATKIQSAIALLKDIDISSPTESLPFLQILDLLKDSEEEVGDLHKVLSEHKLVGKPNKAVESDSSVSPLHIRKLRYYQAEVFRLLTAIRSAREFISDTNSISSKEIMILRGTAGTGKTHSLCDIARQRVARGQPTILLMGQRFIGHDAPWTQALQQLDLGDISTDHFIGALEAAAQAANCRALVMIDAINEGAGRIIWPSNLEAFLAPLERSSWISVVLSIRTPFEDVVIPKHVRERAVEVIHQGFSGHEYDAAKTFFMYYGLELPSTPLLAPEFRNPLFLKTVCQGLNAKGESRLPRGFHGVTDIFSLYLDSVNKQLSRYLDFNPNTKLVHQALESFISAAIEAEQSWLPSQKAEEIVNSFLPGRVYDRSLYNGLIIENILIEDVRKSQNSEENVIAFAGYERFGDYLAAKSLLDKHLHSDDFERAFSITGVNIKKPDKYSLFSTVLETMRQAVFRQKPLQWIISYFLQRGKKVGSTKGGSLSFLFDDRRYVSPGLLEALSVLIPERTGKELVSIAPDSEKSWEVKQAFWKSLIWRAHTAFSGETYQTISALQKGEDDFNSAIDVLLTLATLPNHPLNADFLDRRLRKDSMAERDSWWSVYLYQVWADRGTVDRLIDWASSVDTATAIDDEVVNLSGITLIWMLSTSNRFLRDRATKALVNLLTGRLHIMSGLVDRFSDVDDLYVAERVYAVAYGIAMRSHDLDAVGDLASCVYKHVFACGTPPGHILLRDYARGVIERGLYLGAEIKIIPDLIRPPYKSTWPTIPTEKDIQVFRADWSKGSYDSGDLEWGHNRIEFSVMDDDFARYIIGTNNGRDSSDWLSVRLDEPLWRPPISAEEKLEALVQEFSIDEREAWDAFQKFNENASHVIFGLLRQLYSEEEGEDTSSLDFMPAATFETALREAYPDAVEEAETQDSEAKEALKAVLTPDHMHRIEEIWQEDDEEHHGKKEPRFDLRLIQRYILNRVFELGWTKERFGYFDRFVTDSNGRASSKPERVGKKYQWIAYHEILAFISDHFQYRERFNEEGASVFEGPYQIHGRDIDPSTTMRSKPGGTPFSGHKPSWWESIRYEAWGEPKKQLEWITSFEDTPKVDELLIVTNPIDNSSWLNIDGHFHWNEKSFSDEELVNTERRSLWMSLNGYLIRNDDGPAFLEWAKTVDFWNRWMPESNEVFGMFLGEHGWASASQYFQKQYGAQNKWIQPEKGCPVEIRLPTFDYACESNSYDCSLDDGFRLTLPSIDLIEGLKIRWNGLGADFVDDANQIIVQDPTAHEEGPSALLIKLDPLQEFLNREQLTICWTVLGEKMVFTPGIGSSWEYPRLRMSGAYMLSGGLPIGFVKHMLDDPENEKQTPTSDRLQVIGFT